jgi:hypothetical protein
MRSRRIAGEVHVLPGITIRKIIGITARVTILEIYHLVYHSVSSRDSLDWFVCDCDPLLCSPHLGRHAVVEGHCGGFCGGFCGGELEGESIVQDGELIVKL